MVNKVIGVTTTRFQAMIGDDLNFDQQCKIVLQKIDKKKSGSSIEAKDQELG